MTLVIRKPSKLLEIQPPDGGVIRAEIASSTIVIAAGVGPQGPPGPIGDGITEEEHENLDSLTHGLVEAAWEEYLYTGKNLTQYIVWTSPAKLIRVRDSAYTYTGNNLTTVVTKQYDELGALLTTLTKTLVYAGKNLESVTVVRT